MTTVRENLERQLSAARSAAERSRAAGESDAAEQAQIGRLQGELEELIRINKEAAPAVARMEADQARERQAEELARTQRQNKEHREAREQIEAFRENQLGQWLDAGGDEAGFARAWPEIESCHLQSKLLTDEDRAIRSGHVF